MVALSFYATGSFQAVTTILENSALKICLRAMPFPKDGFLGIVGRPRLLTPVINPTSQPEERYNAKFWCLDALIPAEGHFFIPHQGLAK